MTDKDTRTVLLVDDDIDFLEQHRLLLESAGLKVVSAESQAQAEELLENLQPDIAICDLMMEHTDGGFALCYHIKKRYPTTPVILVSAVASETGMEFDASTDEERSWIKADAFLTKPVRFEQLQGEIDRLLAKARS